MEHETRRGRRQGFRSCLLVALGALAGFLITVVLLASSWNLFAPRLFGLEALDMRGATGLLLFALLLSAVLRGPGWQRMGARHARK
ncbi:MAG: hypothetical protein OEW35_09955 [Gammaproteobacteria bacterium]|nr:hypothetical protein [Gammaproteobacteria bacterium]MDH4255128.1 hypothetical protein [Gammaproteobacteria bacterium]MDH5309838.1 hypothetical protein [Gammaproteobacteria bacterium]